MPDIAIYIPSARDVSATSSLYSDFKLFVLVTSALTRDVSVMVLNSNYQIANNFVFAESPLSSLRNCNPKFELFVTTQFTPNIGPDTGCINMALNR